MLEWNGGLGEPKTSKDGHYLVTQHGNRFALTLRSINHMNETEKTDIWLGHFGAEGTAMTAANVHADLIRGLNYQWSHMCESLGGLTSKE